MNRPGAVSTRMSMYPDVKELRRDLRKLDPETSVPLRAALRAANQTAARMLVDAAQRNAEAMGGMQAGAAGQIKAAKVEKGIRLRLANNKRVPYTLAAFWGMKQRTGWYARRRYEDGPPQHPEWVGASWDVGVRGEGPYAVNDAIAEKRDEVLDYWRAALDTIARDAGFA